MSKQAWAIVVVLAAGLAAGAGLAAAKDDKPAPPEVPFKGKVAVFSIRKDEAKKITALEGPAVKRLGDVDFLTGRVVGSTAEGDWRVGAVIWVPVVDLGEVVEFRDLREAKKGLGLYP